MRPFRNLKIADLIEHELGKILARDFFVEDTLVTITSVQVDEDLLHAKVKLGIIPEANTLEVLRALHYARGRFQQMLVKKLRIKPVPHIAFVADDHKDEVVSDEISEVVSE